MPERTYQSGRFQSATGMLDIDRLERETRSTFFLGIIVALALQMTLAAGMRYFTSEVAVVRPPTMHLVIHQPRMTRPFLFRKKPQHQRQFIKHTHEPVVPDIVVSSTAFGTVRIVCDGEYQFEGISSEQLPCFGDMPVPQLPDALFELAHIPRLERSLRDELISINDLDTGQYRALVTIDPENVRNTEGFIYISMLWGTEITPPFKRAVMHLIDAVNGFTNVTAKPDRHLFIGDERLMKFPFVLLNADDGFQLTPQEAKNFGTYLRSGGFVVLDNGDPTNEFSAAEAALRQSLRDALGNDARFLPIPNNHDLYHSFFDFHDGPPQGMEVDLTQNIQFVEVTSDTSSMYYPHRVTISKQVFFLDGVFLDDRLVAVYSDKGYAECWDHDMDNDAQIRMGVNMVMFALTQKGGIAQQKMDILSFDNVQGIERDEADILGVISNRLVDADPLTAPLESQPSMHNRTP